MASSSKKPRTKRRDDGLRECEVCHEPKSITLFPSNDATTCTSCTRAPPAPVESTPEPADDAPIEFPQAEIDYAHPSTQEIAARTLARRKLIHFIKRFKPKYMAGWIHQDICRRLERFMKAVEEQKSPRLLLMMPYRHGKSEIVSKHFPPFVLGHHPDWEVIAASNAQSLATSFSRHVRDLMRDPSYHALFEKTRLDPSSQAVENWNLTKGGGYLAAGAGSAIIGRGATVLVLDDLFRNAEEADSQVTRDSIWDWYLSTAYSRLAPGGGVLGVTTCWNEDDWAGRVQEAAGMGGDVFEVVKYPAVNDMGDEYILVDDTIRQFPPNSLIPEGAVLTRPMNTALHPARYTLDMLLQIKANYYARGNQRWWAAGYQQDPTPADGVFFTKEMLVEYTHPPKRHGRLILQAWDFAITEKQKSDWTVGITGLMDEYDNLYIVDLWRFKTDDGIELGMAVAQYALTWQANHLAVEDGQIWKSIKVNFEKACESLSSYPSYEAITPFTDKRTRAQPARGRMQQKKVQFPKHAPWWPIMKNELLRFEAGGKHDDQVDALAHLVRLATAQATPKAPEPKNAPKSWKDKLRAYMNNSVGTGHMAA